MLHVVLTFGLSSAVFCHFVLQVGPSESCQSVDVIYDIAVPPSRLNGWDFHSEPFPFANKRIADSSWEC